jgi:tRNA threonylcarbamoyladenosine biosynthesis protein TsaB
MVLGIDTATRSTAVALRLDDGRTTQARDDPPAGEHPGHATRLLAMAHELLAAAGVGWSELERIAVGVGPGTFTGLRVGVATARALAQSLSAELVGVSSLQALALPALAAASETGGGAAAGGTDAVLAVIDARRGEAFAAAYERRDGQEVPAELLAARALAPQDLRSLIAAAAERGAAPEGHWLAIGDGAVRFRAHLEGADVAVPPDSSALHRVSAEAICGLGTLAEPLGSLELLLPDYRRQPDALLALETAAAGSPGHG